MIPGGFFSQQQWVDVKNNNAADAPAFSVLRTTGFTVGSADDTTYFTCDQPNVYGDTGSCLIAGPVPITAGNYGRASAANIVLALYDDNGGTDTPAYGDAWGPISGSWKMSKKGDGWIAMGAPTNTTAKIAVFRRAPMLIARGYIATNCGSSTVQDMTVYKGAWGSEVSTGQVISSVRNPNTCTILSVDICSAIYIQEYQEWQFIAGGT